MDTELMTWGDVERFAKVEKLDHDEYFLLSMETSVNERVWTPTTWNVAVWMAKGANEGYYVHVDAIVRQEGKRAGVRKPMAGGKFWKVETAMHAVEVLTRFIHGFPLTPG